MYYILEISCTYYILAISCIYGILEICEGSSFGKTCKAQR
jgi:hypothetical protein